MARDTSITGDPAKDCTEVREEIYYPTT